MTQASPPPFWFGSAVAVCGILNVLTSGLWPVLDDRPLKMSCYWADKASIGLGTMLACCGLAGLLTPSRDGGRVVAGLAIVAGLLQLLTGHVLIPYMQHNQPHQRVHDLFALIAIAAAAAAWAAMRPKVDVDEALDAAAAALEQPDA